MTRFAAPLCCRTLIKHDSTYILSPGAMNANLAESRGQNLPWERQDCHLACLAHASAPRGAKGQIRGFLRGQKRGRRHARRGTAYPGRYDVLTMLIKGIWWRVFAISFLALISVAAWVQLGVEASLIPMYGEICEKPNDVANKDCTQYYITLFAFFRLLRFLEDHNGAITALATVVIGVFTVVLAQSTNKLWEESKKATESAEKAALAAKSSADVLPLIERAYVFAKVRFDKGVPSIFRSDGTYSFTVLFVNRGKTPAVISMLRGYATVADVPPIQLNTIPRPAAEPLPEGLVIASGNAFSQTVMAHITNDDLRDLNDRSRRLYCVGLIKYRDILGEDRETGFCWEYRLVPRVFGIAAFNGPATYGEFVFCRNSNLNYTT